MANSISHAAAQARGDLIPAEPDTVAPPCAHEGMPCDVKSVALGITWFCHCECDGCLDAAGDSGPLERAS